MNHTHQNLTTTTKIIAVLILITNISFALWYIFYGYQAFFHSDSATKILLAREIVESGMFFPPEWNYANHDLFVFFGQLFVIPLLSFIPAGYTAHAISGAIVYALILHSTWLFSGIINTNTTQKILVLAAISTGISGLLAENLFGQASYGASIILLLYVLFFIIQYRTITNHKKYFYVTGIITVTTLLFWSNPARGVIYIGIPLLGALTWLSLTINKEHLKTNIKIMMFVLIGITIGTLLHYDSISSTNNIMGAGNPRWLSFESSLNNLSLTLKGVMAILGSNPNVNGNLISINGVYESIRLLLALALIFLITHNAIKETENESPNIKFISIFTIISLLLALFFHVFTTIPDMSNPIQSSRYLIPSIFIGLIFLISSRLNFREKPIYSLGIVISTLILAASAYPTLKMSNLNSLTNLNHSQINELIENRIDLISFLKENNLGYGYSGYWNSGAYSVLSDEKVRIRQINIENGVPMPMKWLGSNRWYNPENWEGITFLLLHINEASLLDWSKLESFGLTPIKTLEFNDNKIFIFNENIASKIPGWYIH